MPRHDYGAAMTKPSAEVVPVTRDQIRILACPGNIYTRPVSPTAVKIVVGDRVEVFDLVPDEGPDRNILESPVGPYTPDMVIDVLIRLEAAYGAARAYLQQHLDHTRGVEN